MFNRKLAPLVLVSVFHLSELFMRLIYIDKVSVHMVAICHQWNRTTVSVFDLWICFSLKGVDFDFLSYCAPGINRV